MDATAAPASGARAGRRQFFGLAVLGLPTMLASLDMSVLYLALPHLAAGLHANSIEQVWITDIYGFFIAGFLVTMGSVGDRIGRRRLLLTGAAAFAACSVLAAYSANPEMLIIARALLGISGATLMPSIMALIGGMFQDPKQHAMAMAIWMGFFMGGMALGPIVGGLLLTVFWWGSVFLIGVPVMLTLLLLGPRVLPEFSNPAAGRLDPISVVLSLGTTIPIVYGATEMARYGAGAPRIGAIALGVVLGILFVRRQLSSANPLLDLQLFRNRTFRSSIALTPLSGIMAGTSLFVYQYVQLVDRLSPLHTALWMLPSTILTVLSIQATPILAQRVRPGSLIAGGLVIVAIGYFMLTQLNSQGNLPLLVGGLVVSAIGIGPIAMLTTSLTIGSVPIEKMGGAASMSATAGEFGIAMGVATMGTIGNTVYQHEIAHKIGPEFPASAATAARESIADAAATASRLPAALGGHLMEIARGALAPAMNVSALCSAIVALLMVVLALIAYRHIPSPKKTQETTAQQPDLAASAVSDSAAAESD